VWPKNGRMTRRRGPWLQEKTAWEYLSKKRGEKVLLLEGGEMITLEEKKRGKGGWWGGGSVKQKGNLFFSNEEVQGSTETLGALGPVQGKKEECYSERLHLTPRTNPGWPEV